MLIKDIGLSFPFLVIFLSSEAVKLLSHVWLFAIPWTIAYQASPSVEFSRQEYWSGLPFPSLGGIFPTQGSNPGLLHCRQTLYHLSHQGSRFWYINNTVFIKWVGKWHLSFFWRSCFFFFFKICYLMETWCYFPPKYLIEFYIEGK